MMMNGRTYVKSPAIGGQGQNWDDKARGRIRRIYISHGDSINSIQIQYESDSTPSKHGGDGGGKFTPVDLGSSSLSEITGYYGFHQNNTQKQVVIRSLKFVFDDGKEPITFGSTANEGEPFSFMLNGAGLGGFHGRLSPPRIGRGSFKKPLISAIGIYVETLATSVPRGLNSGGQNDDKFFKVGARGATGVKHVPWDDRVQGQARQIFICHGESINFIQTAYENNSGITLSPGHGGEGGNKFEVVNLSVASFSRISGYYGHHQNNSNKPKVIRSLKFRTDDSCEYGPFGNTTEEGSCFQINVEGARTGGFHGRQTIEWLATLPLYTFVSAIGIYHESYTGDTTSAG